MSAKIIPTKTRVRAWIQTIPGAAEWPIKHGIQGFVPGRGWMHLSRGSDPLLFDDADEAQAEAKRLRAEWREMQRPAPPPPDTVPVGSGEAGR